MVYIWVLFTVGRLLLINFLKVPRRVLATRPVVAGLQCYVTCVIIIVSSILSISLGGLLVPALPGCSSSPGCGSPLRTPTLGSRHMPCCFVCLQYIGQSPYMPSNVVKCAGQAVRPDMYQWTIQACAMSGLMISTYQACYLCSSTCKPHTWRN